MKKSINDTIASDRRAAALRILGNQQGGRILPNQKAFARAKALRKIEERRWDKEVAQ